MYIVVYILKYIVFMIVLWLFFKRKFIRYFYKIFKIILKCMYIKCFGFGDLYEFNLEKLFLEKGYWFGFYVNC